MCAQIGTEFLPIGSTPDDGTILSQFYLPSPKNQAPPKVFAQLQAWFV